MPSTFRLQVCSLRSVLFDGDVKSVYLFGDQGEYELLPYHFPIMGALLEGEVRIMGHDPIPIKSGVVMFNDNRCTIIVEEVEGVKIKGVSWSDVEPEKGEK